MSGLIRMVGVALKLAAILFSICPVRVDAEQYPPDLQEERRVRDEIKIFSSEWLEQFSTADVGCKQANTLYQFRPVGWGSNLNNFLLTWMRAIALYGDEDMALVFESDQPLMSGNVLVNLRCEDKTGEAESMGWPCLFRDMPHVCTFETRQEWEDFQQTSRLDDGPIKYNTFSKKSQANVKRALEEAGVDYLRALAVLAFHLGKHMQPWFQDDMTGILGSKKIKAIRASPYVAFHIRRGDKIHKGVKAHSEAEKINAQKYVSMAAQYLSKFSTFVAPEDIESVWVSSDDPDAVTEVQGIVSQYLSGVPPSNVTTILPAAELPEFHPLQDVTGDGFVQSSRSFYQTYLSSVNFFVELRLLTEATVFVGTFSSNVGRYVALLRETHGQDRDTALSADKQWFPGR